jgi:hypothetical protein
LSQFQEVFAEGFAEGFGERFFGRFFVRRVVVEVFLWKIFCGRFVVEGHGFSRAARAR